MRDPARSSGRPHRRRLARRRRRLSQGVDDRDETGPLRLDLHPECRHRPEDLAGGIAARARRDKNGQPVHPFLALARRWLRLRSRGECAERDHIGRIVVLGAVVGDGRQPEEQRARGTRVRAVPIAASRPRSRGPRWRHDRRRRSSTPFGTGLPALGSRRPPRWTPAVGQPSRRNRPAGARAPPSARALGPGFPLVAVPAFAAPPSLHLTTTSRF